MQALSYIFSPVPGSAFNYSTLMMIYAAALIVIGIVVIIIIRLNRKNKAFRKVYKTMPGHFIWIGIALIILTASRTNAIPYLSMRFLLYVTLFISLYLVFINIYKFFTKYPEMKKITKPKPTKEVKKKKYSTKK